MELYSLILRHMLFPVHFLTDGEERGRCVRSVDVCKSLQTMTKILRHMLKLLPTKKKRVFIDEAQGVGGEKRKESAGEFL